VHRIGRTGRAGATGKAVSLVAPEEKRYLADIEKLIKRSIPMEALPGYSSAERYETAPSQERSEPRSGGRGRDRERSKPRPMRETTVEAVQEKRPEEIPALIEAPFTPRPGRKKEVAALLLRRGSTTTE